MRFCSEQSLRDGCGLLGLEDTGQAPKTPPEPCHPVCRTPLPHGRGSWGLEDTGQAPKTPPEPCHPVCRTPLPHGRGSWGREDTGQAPRTPPEPCHPADRLEACPTGRQSGFTMIEAIVMIIIIGVLAGLIGLKVIGRVGEAKQNVAIANAATLREAVNLFKVDGNSLQNGDSLREILWEGPNDDRRDNWKGPYIEKEKAMKDPWNREFILRYPPEVHSGFDIVSYGADGKPGGEEDNADIIE